MTPELALRARFTRLFPLLAVCLPAAALLPACGLQQDDGFREGVPTSDAVTLKLPGDQAVAQSALQAGDGTVGVRSALLGEQADLYTTTRAVTKVVNGGTYAVLTLVHTIVEFPPTDVTADSAVWGPHSEPLDRNAWRLTVHRLAPHSYDYVLEARAKQAPDSAFIAILTGHHNAIVMGAGKGQVVEGLGTGTFTVDWDAAQTLPEHDMIVGKADFTYARESFSTTMTIGVDFTGVKDDKTGEIYNAAYQYAATPGAGGDFQYAAHQDILPGPGPTGSAKELLTMHSRWLETGAGRGDVLITGGDAPTAPAPTVNECWDINFMSTFKNTSYDPAQTWGQESTCAFTPAAYSSLS
jgi:hypothetical protein